jgi:transposase
MRGNDYNQSGLFSYFSSEQRVPQDHPLRPIRRMCDQALGAVSAELGKMYSALGRPSIPPEQLLRALLLQVLYSVRSERMLMEQLHYNLLFRWFVGLDLEEAVWDASSFSKNRDRLLEGDIAESFFAAVQQQAQGKGLLSDEHFSVDGSLLEAWASEKSFQKKQKPPQRGSGSRGKMLLRDTHESTTDPDARMYRKGTGQANKLCHMVHVLMENRNGLPVAGRATEANTGAEWKAAEEMLSGLTPAGKHRTVGADAGFDYPVFVQAARALAVTPHVALHPRRSPAIDGRTTRHAGYQISLGKRKRIEQIFGWLKTTAVLRKVRHRGRKLVQWVFVFALAAYNLVRIRNLSQVPSAG